MGRTVKAVIDSLPKGRRLEIEARYRQLKGEVESLAALRKAAGKAQAEIATTLNISQPSVSKIENQTDMYLSTLSNYVRAIGGDLELVVRLPSQVPLRLYGLGDLVSRPSEARAHDDVKPSSSRNAQPVKRSRRTA